MATLNIQKINDADKIAFNKVKAALAESVGKSDIENATVLRLMMQYTQDGIDSDRFQVRTDFNLEPIEEGASNAN